MLFWSLDSLAASRLEGSEGGVGPFWSPDGASLGYFGGGMLRVVDLRSGTTRKLCPTRRTGGGTWTTKNVIVYSPDFLSSPLFKVSAEGGPCTQLTKYRPGESIHRRPSARVPAPAVRGSWPRARNPAAHRSQRRAADCRLETIGYGGLQRRLRRARPRAVSAVVLGASRDRGWGAYGLLGRQGEASASASGMGPNDAGRQRVLRPCRRAPTADTPCGPGVVVLVIARS